MKKLVIIDYGHGNANSIKRAISSFKIEAIYSNKADDILSSDWIILPGVGHFKPAMESLSNNDIIEVINYKVLEMKTPVLGICLGFQIMASHSEEGDSKGLDWINTSVKKITPQDKIRFKVPHVGWRTLNERKSTLLEGIDIKKDPFYFCHKYYVKALGEPNECTFTYDQKYSGLFEKSNIFGVQFHPEKSHSQGLKLLQNFLK